MPITRQRFFRIVPPAAVAIALLTLPACALRAARKVDAVLRCGASSATIPMQFDSAQIQTLAGRFRLVQVITSRAAGRKPIVWVEGTLTLARPTSAELVASHVKNFGHRPRSSLQLVGRWADDALAGRPDTAEVDANVLYIGCRDCMDGSPTNIRIQGMSTDRFWGRWEDPMSGIVVLRDPDTGEPLKEVTGSFCATRLDR